MNTYTITFTIGKNQVQVSGEKMTDILTEARQIIVDAYLPQASELLYNTGMRYGATITVSDGTRGYGLFYVAMNDDNEPFWAHSIEIR